MAAWNNFQCLVGDVAHKLHDMKTGSTDVYKVYLTNTAPAAGNTVALAITVVEFDLADVPEPADP